jgi:alcohol dehydrogenase
MTTFALLRMPRQVLFGAGQRSSIGTVTAGLGRRAFICTDRRFAESPTFVEIERLLRDSGVDVSAYTDGLPDVPVERLPECLDAVRRARPDVIIGVGGGSCLDLAKTVAILHAHGGAASDYYGEFKVPGPTMPIVAVPTTAGTGSEVTPIAVLSDPGRVSKVGISSPHIIPHTAICDPELTYGAPPGLTASAGADALSHAVESFTAIRRPASGDLATSRVFVGKNDLTDHYALLAIRLIAASFHRAWSDPHDTEARDAMMLAATCAGFALGTAGTAAAHAIQYPVGAATGSPHGVGVGALLPYVMEFNRPVREAELAQIARAMGVDAGADDAALAVAAVRAVTDLLASVGIPRTLRELGLPDDRLDWIAEQSLSAARLVQNNPRPLDLEAVRRIVVAAHSGDPSELAAPTHEPVPG